MIRLRAAAPLLLAVMLAGCGSASATNPTGAPASSATGTPSVSAASTQVGTPSPTVNPAGALAPDGIAEVVTNDLVVRSLPEISGESIVDPVRLSEGKFLFVLDGPVTADGHDWYQVAPFDVPISDIADGSPRLGWVAAGGDGEEWIAPWAGDCPEASVDALRNKPGYLLVACFGDRELTLEGELGDCDFIVPGTVSPDWLSSASCILYEDNYEGDLFGPFAFHLLPEDFQVKDGSGQRVRVTGHFDHPAAQTCEHHPLDGEEPLPPELVVLGCRAAFVVTVIEILQ